MNRSTKRRGEYDETKKRKEEKHGQGKRGATATATEATEAAFNADSRRGVRSGCRCAQG